MAFLPGIFGGGNKQSAAPNQQNNQQGQQQPQNQQLPGNGGGQQNPNQTQNGNGSGGPASRMDGPQNSTMNSGGNPMNPMDPFLQLMTPSPDVMRSMEEQNKPKSIFGAVDPAALDAHVRKASFIDGIDPARVQAALGGDANAFMEVLNAVGQNGFKASLQMNQGMIEHGVKTGLGNFDSSLDSRFRDLQLKNQNTNNAALKHPLGKAMLSGIANQIAAANPKMSPTEVQAKAEEALSSFAQQMIPQKGADSDNQNGSQEPNWESFLQ